MEIISRISKGSRMDQIYIPKKRFGFSIGNYVLIKPLDIEKSKEKPYFYNIEALEPIKLEIVSSIFRTINRTVKTYENIIITGSFLDSGFNFNDIDIIVISEDKLNLKNVKRNIENKIKIKIHILLFDNKSLIKGLSTDPLYQIMLSRCIAKKRFIYKIKPKINYRILDLHLLKSKLLIDNFDILDGNEKYDLTRNLVAISLFLQNKKLNKEKIDREIKKQFSLEDIKEIKQNILKKEIFLKKYKTLYNKTFNKIMEGIKSKNVSK